MDGNEIVAKMALEFSQIVARNTATAIFDKIKAIKANKNLGEQNKEFQTIINDLISDKNDLIRIVQVYEQELSSQKITDDDIDYITKNVFPLILELLPENEMDKIKQINSIFSKETLTILQLIGFNYKKAIGEPLTNRVHDFIDSKLSQRNDNSNVANVNDGTEVIKIMADLAKDKDAYERFVKLSTMREHNNGTRTE